MSRNSQPDKASTAQRNAASKAAAKLKGASRNFLLGKITEEQYFDTYTKLSAVILGAGMKVPEVAWVDIKHAA